MATPTRIPVTEPRQVTFLKPQKIGKATTERVFVDPPAVHLGSGDSRLKVIEWVNQTGSDVLIWLPNGHNYLNGKPEDFLTPFSVADGKKLARGVRADCKDGDYEYNVYCKGIDGYAEGNSPPHVSCP